MHGKIKEEILLSIFCEQLFRLEVTEDDLNEKLNNLTTSELLLTLKNGLEIDEDVLYEEARDKDLTCPISLEIMRGAVRIEQNGRAYDFDSIQKLQKTAIVYLDENARPYIKEPTKNTKIYVEMENEKPKIPTLVDADTRHKILLFLIDKIKKKYAEKKNSIRIATELMLSNLGIKCAVSNHERDSFIVLKFANEISPEILQCHKNQLEKLLGLEKIDCRKHEIIIFMPLNNIIEKLQKVDFNDYAIEEYKPEPQVYPITSPIEAKLEPEPCSADFGSSSVSFFFRPSGDAVVSEIPWLGYASLPPSHF